MYFNSYWIVLIHKLFLIFLDTDIIGRWMVCLIVSMHRAGFEPTSGQDPREVTDNYLYLLSQAVVLTGVHIFQLIICDFAYHSSIMSINDDARVSLQISFRACSKGI